MTETLRDKLIRCGWVTNFNADTLVKLIERHYAALAQPEPEGPTDEELLELMPKTMRDEFGYAAKVCSDATGGQVKPGIFRVCLNHTALEYARAVFARWGRPAIEPVPVSERPWERNGWCDENGWCWGFDADDSDPYWIFDDPASCPCWTHLLPHYALPVPEA